MVLKKKSEVISTEDLLHHSKHSNNLAVEIQEEWKKKKLMKENCRRCRVWCKNCERKRLEKDEEDEGTMEEQTLRDRIPEEQTLGDKIPDSMGEQGARNGPLDSQESKEDEGEKER